jgi:hypothetical protein
VYPLLKLLCAVRSLRLECVQIPEAFVDQVKDVFVKSKRLLVLSEKLKARVANVLGEKGTKLAVVGLFHCAHFVQVQGRWQRVDEALKSVIDDQLDAFGL